MKGRRVDEEALRLACRLVREGKGAVHVLYVIEVARSLPLDAEIPAETAKGEEALARMEEVGKECKCHVEGAILQAREAGPAVVQDAEERGVDLIVMGMPYERLYGVSSLGHTVPHVLKNASCPVLVWREGMSPEAEAHANASTREQTP
ncbi:MAG: universal stress protein [Chloroflexi bacterium]|nr:universal stress protein [Chloroflexota bacterium]